MIQRLIPAHFPPRIIDGCAEHGFGDAFLVGRIAPGEAAFHAGMAVIGLPVLVRRHPHHAVALKLGFEGAADAAISAGGDDGALRLSMLDHRFFDQRRGGTGLHTGAAGNAFGIEEVLIHAGRYM